MVLDTTHVRLIAMFDLESAKSQVRPLWHGARLVVHAISDVKTAMVCRILVRLHREAGLLRLSEIMGSSGMDIECSASSFSFLRSISNFVFPNKS